MLAGYSNILFTELENKWTVLKVEYQNHYLIITMIKDFSESI